MAASAVLISLIPLGYLFTRVFSVGEDNFFALATEPRTLELLVNSLLIALAVSVSAVVLGSIQAWIAVRSNLPGRKVFSVLSAMPLAIPSYVAAYSWLALFPSFNGFFAVWLVLTVGTAPIVYLAVSASLARFDAATEEVAQSLGASRLRVFWEITWPSIRPSATSAGLLSALYVLSDFGAVSILRYDTFTRAIYNAYRASFDRNLAATLALILVMVTVLVMFIELRARGKYVSGTVMAKRLGFVSLGKARNPLIVLLILASTVGIAVPIYSLIRWSVVGFAEVDIGEVFEALGNSVVLALSGGLLASVVSVAVAVVVVRYRSAIGSVLERSIWLTHATPGVVVALSLVFFANQVAPWIYQSTALVLIAYLALFLPNALAAVSTPLSQSPKSLDEVAASLGLSKLKVLYRVVFPVALPGILAATALVILTILKELPATLLLRPTGVDTLATRLWSETSVAAFSDAAPYALLLVVLAGFPAWLLNRAIRKDLATITDLERA